MNHTINRKPDPRLHPVKVYLGEEELATLQSHCHAIDTTCSAFLRKVGLRIASAHQQVIRYPGRREGPSAGLGRAFSFPGQGARRVQRGALRPMRS
ncbi:hypothetical protein [Duganella violaceipulchra]|uniref:Uncharacterized protein n=1 Tax=Duganella violaceipulchra TaxID=2849652 RepID=A0AA41H7G5_9BURK|nr:hypothetical protein [Duganella violaceicalia]MBV6321944.1 hypothetical protein [Duganella violaceicalia]MCP2007062.1 hypothetical protein [Duganella violaceicalia]